MPPVSTSSKATPFHSVASRLRSRVTPGSGEVTASLPPTRRLTRVLLPTLGKPTTATVGRLTRALAVPFARGADGRNSCSRQTSFLGEGDDAGDDLVKLQGRGVDLHRVFGGAQGAVLALRVAGVAL